jgi:hypothetical protein
MWEFLNRKNPALPVPPRESPPAEWRAANTYLYAGQEAPVRFAEYDTIMSGGKGTGKTTALIALMISLISSRIAASIHFNVHAFTPKPDDFYPLLKAIFEPLGIKVRCTNPFIEESWSWDGSMDLKTPPAIDELVATTIKDDGRDMNPFFKKTAQLVLRGIIQSFSTTHPGLWTMRQVVNVMKDVRLIQQVLARSEHTRHITALLTKKLGITAANLHATLLAELKGLELVASLIDETPDDRRFSAREAANSPRIITVWGSDPRYSTTVDPWNGIQWELIGHELLIRGDINVETFLFIDEFPQLNGGHKLAIIKKLLEFARSSKVRSTLAVQSPAQVEAIYGKEEADTILGQCHNAIVFKHSDNRGCEYWSQRLGRMQGIEPKRSYSRQRGGSYTGGQHPSWSESWSGTESVTYERYDRDRVPQNEIRDLPVGSYEYGMFGYATLPLSLRKDPKTGFPEPIKFRFHMTPEWIAEHVPDKGDFTPYAKSLKCEDSYTLNPLDDWEYDFLGLTRP